MMQYKKRYVVALLAILFVSSLPVLAEDNSRVYTHYSGTHEVVLSFVRPDREINENDEARQYRRYSGTHEVVLSFVRPDREINENDEVRQYRRYSGTHELDLFFTTPRLIERAKIREAERQERREAARLEAERLEAERLEAIARRGDGATTAYVEEPRQEERGDGAPLSPYVEEEVPRGDGATTAYVEEETDRRGDGATTRYTEADSEEAPEMQPTPPHRVPGNVRIKSVKLLQVRETSRGGSLPFDATDVEQEISPKGVRASQSNPVTCANQRFPTVGMTNNPILFLFPDAGGECEVGLTVSNNAEVAFNITSISASTANVTASNGWNSNRTSISYGIGGTIADTITLSRNGVSYTIGIEAEGTGIGAFPIYINVTSFSGPN